MANLRGSRDVAIARAAAVRVQEEHVADLEKRDRAGQAVAAELARAKIDLFRARAELRTAAAEWNIAEAKLRQAMGLLVRE